MIRKATVTVEIYVQEDDDAYSLAGYFYPSSDPVFKDIGKAVEEAFKVVADDANSNGYGYSISVVGSNPAKVVYE